MKKRNLLLLIFLLISMILGACKPSQAELDAQATQVAADDYSTQTALAPTATKTLTPTPTNTPTITPTPLPDMSGVVLMLEDLPPGFEEVPPEDLGFTPENLSTDMYVVETIFSFVQLEPLEIVVGYNLLIPRKDDQLNFDLILNQPEVFLETQIGIEPTDILELEVLPDLAIYGDASNGFTLLAEAGLEMVMRIDMVVIRRDAVGTILFIMYYDGETPVVTIDEIASKMDERIIEALPSSK